MQLNIQTLQEIADKEGVTRQAVWLRTSKGKAWQKTYRQTEKYKAYMKEYGRKRREYQKKYNKEYYMKTRKVGKLQKKCDKLVKEIAFMRDQGKCVKCGCPADDPGHIISRRKKILRWDVDNVLSLSRICHSRATAHPKEWQAWVKANYPDLWKYLKSKENEKTHYKLHDYIDLKERLQKVLDKLNSM